MSHSFNRWIAVAGLAGLLIAGAPARAALDDALGFERTPPRLSYVDGEVSFFRPGTQYWEPASLNTPLAAGDEFYAAEAANLEIQIGARAYLRAGEETQLALSTLEPDFLQIFVAEGHVSLDLRSVKASQTFEIDTPNAAFTIEHSGYYRVEVAGDSTRLITRRGGRASVTYASGTSSALVASEQVVISGADAPQLGTYAAPELDAWDRWNYARTQAHLDAASARYVPAGVYGADDLDRHGSWRVVPRYGAIWVPRGVAVGWAPYSAGRWIHDPYYGWSWVDAAPWLGALPLRALGPRLRLLGLGAGSRRGAPALRARAGRLLRRRGSFRRLLDRSAPRWLGGPRLGRAHRPLVGPAGRARRAALGRLGRPARRQQRGGEAQDRDPREGHPPLPAQPRAERLRGRGARALRSSCARGSARQIGACREVRAGARRAGSTAGPRASGGLEPRRAAAVAKAARGRNAAGAAAPSKRTLTRSQQAEGALDAIAEHSGAPGTRRAAAPHAEAQSEAHAARAHRRPGGARTTGRARLEAQGSARKGRLEALEGESSEEEW